MPQGNLGSYIQVGKSIGSNKIGNGQTISSSQGTQQQANAQAIIQQTNNISSSANANQNNINLRNLRNPLKGKLDLFKHDLNIFEQQPRKSWVILIKSILDSLGQL